MIDLKNAKRIHCIGIGGIGLSAIADILIAKGYEVSGSDMNKGENVEKLIRDGAKIYIGHSAENVEGADLVIYSAAIGEDNPELARAHELGIKTVTRAEMLGRLMEQSHTSIAIAGTHGKTTTTSMISLILKNADVDPTLLVGGNLHELEGNVRVGHGDYFVTEACEYMDSFLSLRPKVEIILNIDSDHLDYFRDIEHISESFQKFARLVPEDGMIIAYSANPFVSRAVKGLDNVITFGLEESCDYAAINIEFDRGGLPTYELYKHGEQIGTIHLSIPGEHNILNSLAAIACADMLGIELAVTKKTLAEFKGTERRFDILGTTAKGAKVVDDYAHHPTEIRATLSAAHNIPHKKMWVLFQPHTYTRTIALFDEFAASFGEADCVVLVEIYAAREKNIHKISSSSLVPAIKKHFPDKEVHYFPTFEEIAEFVNENSEEGDLIITMGAGDVYKIGEMLIEKGEE